MTSAEKGERGGEGRRGGGEVERRVGGPTDTMLSHNWGKEQADGSFPNHARVVAVERELSRLGLVSWLDAQDMTESVVGDQCVGIENASVVVVFVTTEYERKVGVPMDNCEIELRHAAAHSKPFVPVVMEAEMCSRPWRGALGGLLGGLKYVDMSASDVLQDKHYRERKAVELARLVLRKIDFNPVRGMDALDAAVQDLPPLPSPSPPSSSSSSSTLHRRPSSTANGKGRAQLPVCPDCHTGTGECARSDPSLFHPTEDCRHFAKGVCFLGARCRFIHRKEEAKEINPPDPFAFHKYPVCEVCREGRPGCEREPGLFHPTKDCTAYVTKGECPRGDDCRFIHRPSSRAPTSAGAGKKKGQQRASTSSRPGRDPPAGRREAEARNARGGGGSGGTTKSGTTTAAAASNKSPSSPPLMAPPVKPRPVCGRCQEGRPCDRADASLTHPTEPCKAFSKNGKCLFGTSCPYLHLPSALPPSVTPNNSNSNGENKGKKPLCRLCKEGRAASCEGSPELFHPRLDCKRFANGLVCTKGDQCRFIHRTAKAEERHDKGKGSSAEAVEGQARNADDKPKSFKDALAKRGSGRSRVSPPRVEGLR